MISMVPAVHVGCRRYLRDTTEHVPSSIGWIFDVFRRLRHYFCLEIPGLSLVVVGCCAGGDNRKWRRVSGHKYGLGGTRGHGGWHEGWGRGMVTPTRVTRGHVSRASNMQAWETMGMLHAVAICIVYFLHLLTQRVHFLVELFQHLGDVIHLFCIFIWSSQICRHRVKWWAGGLGRTWCQAESRDGTNKGVAGDRCGLVTIKIQKLYWSHYSEQEVMMLSKLSSDCNIFAPRPWRGLQSRCSILQ